jgi:hypothetical protein
MNAGWKARQRQPSLGDPNKDGTLAMTTQNRFYASPHDSAKSGFVFTDLESYQDERSHHKALHGTEEFELQITDGNQIDMELFVGLRIKQANLTEWFREIQHLTNPEKVGLWFLCRWCDYGLAPALAIIQEGMTIFHGTKKQWAGEWICQAGLLNGIHDQFRTEFETATLIHGRESEGSLQEFRFGGETWCCNPLAY